MHVPMEETIRQKGGVELAACGLRILGRPDISHLPYCFVLQGVMP